jgi:hypothetical protein
MKTDAEIQLIFDKIRRAQNDGVYAPHKPLLVLLALARIQQGLPRQVPFSELDAPSSCSWLNLVQVHLPNQDTILFGI